MRQYKYLYFHGGIVIKRMTINIDAILLDNDHREFKMKRTTVVDKFR